MQPAQLYHHRAEHEAQQDGKRQRDEDVAPEIERGDDDDGDGQWGQDTAGVAGRRHRPQRPPRMRSEVGHLTAIRVWRAHGGPQLTPRP